MGQWFAPQKRYRENIQKEQNFFDIFLIILAGTVEGRELIKLYYQWSPVIVKAMEDDVESKQEIKGIVDSILPMIEKSVK